MRSKSKKPTPKTTTKIFGSNPSTDLIDEIASMVEHTDTGKFVVGLAEYFNATEVVLILRAAKKAKMI